MKKLLRFFVIPVLATVLTAMLTVTGASASYPLVVKSCETIGKKETNRNIEELGIISPTGNQVVGVKGVGREPIILTQTCFRPFKPFLPFKPFWCTGTWLLILNCDQYCNCVWVPTCIE